MNRRLTSEDSATVDDRIGHLQKGQPHPIRISRWEWVKVAVAAFVIGASVTLLGWGECARLRLLLCATGGVQLWALAEGWWKVSRRLRRPVMLDAPVEPLDGSAALEIARENDETILNQIAKLVATPILLFALGVGSRPGRPSGGWGWTSTADRGEGSGL